MDPAVAHRLEQVQDQVSDLYDKHESCHNERSQIVLKMESRFSETNLRIEARGATTDLKIQELSSRVTTIIVCASMLWAILIAASRFI